MVTGPIRGEGPVLVDIEYKVDPEKAPEFLDALRDYPRIRRRDGAMRRGVYYDAENPGVYLENYGVGSWAEHTQQHESNLGHAATDNQFDASDIATFVRSEKRHHFGNFVLTVPKGSLHISLLPVRRQNTLANQSWPAFVKDIPTIFWS